MKVKELYLQNFRCFESLHIEFDEQLTVIVAENGQGKTSILDAVALSFGRLLTKLPKLSGIASKETDLRIQPNNRPAAFMHYWLHATDFGKNDLHWSGGRLRDQTPKTKNEVAATLRDRDKLIVGTKQIDQFANELIDRHNSNEGYFMPMIAYYGTNRAIIDEVKRRVNYRKEFSRFESLVSALNPNTRFKDVFEWFTAMEDLERRKREELRNFDYVLPELKAVRQAVESMLPGFTHPRTEIRPIRFVIDRTDEHGNVQTFRINQLSDGYRITLALAMDLARRMAQANPPYEHEVDGGWDITDPLQSPAIVLIDEVDLHLHPNWQQRVLDDLRRTFPKTQFIVTTHSPQVLTTVDNSCIRILRQRDETGVPTTEVITPLLQTKGVASADVLAKIMLIDPVPNVPEAQALSCYRQLIETDQLTDNPEAHQLRDRLLAHFGQSHPVMQECERLIRLQAIKKRLPPAPQLEKGRAADA